ncbi:uncharacterized protein LOC124354257 [Homalodisca vitripennis]|uniref:uncharacterized protein LOC124354257 n=1 Tax=Homalodisca vitripennis TaxID=197043 RepID=UPI001EEA263C|nr:uncharacterized protein LOC124354257 [Homalodisca vitripennis]
MWLWTTAVTVLSVSLALFLHRRDPLPIYGIYRRPGKFFFFKYWIFRFILYLRKRQTKKNAGFGFFNKPAEEMDKAQELSDSPKAFDAVFFHAVTQDGFYVIAGSERRKHNIVNGLFYVVVPGLGLLCSHKIPDTVLFDAKDDTFGAEGILAQPLEPMKKWKLSYSGEMWLHINPTKQYRVMFNGVWTSNMPIFNFDTDLNPHLVASAIANESWTPSYFRMLKKAHQSHYEQMGQMEATLAVETETYKLSNMAAFRDHSFGRERDWNLMHRYVFHMLFLEDGTRAAVGAICQPSTCSVLQTGYVYMPSGEMCTLEWCDFKLYQHGECGNPPKDYAFRFKAGERVFCVQVAVERESVHYVGWRWEARMVERFVTYRVDGVRGRGVSEWHYHSSRGRPLSASNQDPAWFSEVMSEYYTQKL